MANSIRNPQSAIQNVLVVGGSGYVASLVLPLLPPEFHLRIYDQKPPEWAMGRWGDREPRPPDPSPSRENSHPDSSPLRERLGEGESPLQESASDEPTTHPSQLTTHS